MPFLNRGTLPTNFLDSVSNGMRLAQPEPQYFFAGMVYQAQLLASAMEIDAGNAQMVVKLMAGGGAVMDERLSSFARAADAYPGAIMYVPAFGKNMGDTVKFRRPVYAGGGYTESAREVTTGVATSTSSIAVQAEEVPIVLKQYEGPYDSSNSRVAPYGITEFDAKYRANLDNLVSIVKHHLMHDRTKWLDTVIRDRFRATQYITYADDVTNVLSFTAGAGHSFTLDLILKARKALSDRERAPFPNGRYMAIVPTQVNVDSIQDPIFRELVAHHQRDKNPIFGYLCSVQDVDIFECTTTKTYAPGDTVPNDGNNVPAGTGNNVFEGLIISPDAVGYGQADPPKCFDADDTNFGKEAKVIWRSTEAFQTVDERGVQRFLFQKAS